jgi:hypothetical protein
MSDTTKGKASKSGTVINQCKINDFNAMIEETLKAMEEVLNQREKDLNEWTEDKQKEFYTIFGSKGECVVNVNIPIRGMRNIVKMQARDVMKDCVRRLKLIKGELNQDSFINLIFDPDNPDAPTNSKIPRDPKSPRTFCAFVNQEQQDNYKINIGINFTGRISDGMRTCSAVTGVSSRVATLCHEMSHFEKKFSDSFLGGMGTVDYDVNGRKPLPSEKDKWSYKEHLDGAKILVNKGDENVFDNSYNIEQYFEVKL